MITYVRRAKRIHGHSPPTLPLRLLPTPYSACRLRPIFEGFRRRRPTCFLEVPFTNASGIRACFAASVMPFRRHYPTNNTARRGDSTPTNAVQGCAPEPHGLFYSYVRERLRGRGHARIKVFFSFRAINRFSEHGLRGHR